MAVEEGGGGGGSNPWDDIPSYINRNLRSGNESIVRTALDTLVGWVEEGDASERSDAARALVDDVWDKSRDHDGFLVGTRVSLKGFNDQLDALLPAQSNVEDHPYVRSDGTGPFPPPDEGAGGTRLTPTLIRELQEEFPNLRSVRDDDGQIVVEVSESLSPADARAIGDRVGGNVAVRVVDRPAGDNDPSPAPSGATGGGSTTTGSAGGTAPTQAPPADGTLPEAGTPRQIPGGGELWRVDGSKVYLAYKIPGTNVPLVWEVEDPDRLNAIYGDDVPDYDRELSKDEFKRQSPWRAGLSAEIQNTDENPWQQFMSDFNQAAELRPWLEDPTMQAVMATAYLEGRAPTSDELSTTDWWQDHTADERAWMEESATMGRKEIRRRTEDASGAVADALRDAGMSNAPQKVIDFIAQQRLTGKWSEQYTNEQMRKLADPWAPGKLNNGILAAIRDPDMGSAGDARAVSEGRAAIKARVKDIFENRRVPVATDGESRSERISRIAREIDHGKRTFSEVRHSLDVIASRTEGGNPGALDTAQRGEERVRRLAREWLGPVAGKMTDRSLSEWAGRLRNDPEDGEERLVEHLRDQRAALFPGHKDFDLTYEDIVSPVRNMATNIWGQAVHDEMFLVDLANMGDYTSMQQRLREEGLAQNVEKVGLDMMADLQKTDLGGQVVRSQV